MYMSHLDTTEIFGGGVVAESFVANLGHVLCQFPEFG